MPEFLLQRYLSTFFIFFCIMKFSSISVLTSRKLYNLSVRNDEWT